MRNACSTTLNLLGIATGLLSLISTVIHPADAANVTYAFPDLQACMFPQVNNPCVANATEIDYPVRNPDTGKLYKGCYDKKFNRMSDVDVSGKCISANAPIRVEVTYFTQCTTGTATCVADARVVVRPKIFGDLGDVITLRMTGSKSDNVSGGLDPVVLDPNQSGDPAYDSCRAIKEMGYNWDPINRTCNIDPSRQCQRLGFVWENSRCINKCDPAICTRKMCTGYVYQPDNQTCVCIGNSVTTDQNNAPCVETTTSPAASPSPICMGFITVVNSEKGQTETGTYVEGGVTKTFSIGGNKNRTAQFDCTQTLPSVTLDFSDTLPPMCVRCASGTPACGYYKSSGSSPSCVIPTLADGATYYIFTYPQGGNAAPTPSPSVAPTATPAGYSPIPTPSAPLQDISLNSFTINAGIPSFSGGATTMSINAAGTVVGNIDAKSGFSPATATVCVNNSGASTASVNIYISGPISGCTIAAARAVPSGTTCFTSSSCTINGAPGKQCAKAYVEFVDGTGEDSNTTNNSKGLELQIFPDWNKALTAGACN